MYKVHKKLAVRECYIWGINHLWVYGYESIQRSTQTEPLFLVPWSQFVYCTNPALSRMHKFEDWRAQKWAISHPWRAHKWTSRPTGHISLHLQIIIPLSWLLGSSQRSDKHPDNLIGDDTYFILYQILQSFLEHLLSNHLRIKKSRDMTTKLNP